MLRLIFSLLMAIGLLTATVQSDAWAACRSNCRSHCCRTSVPCGSACGCETQMVTKTVMVPTYVEEMRTCMRTEYQREEKTRTYTVYNQVPVTEEKTCTYTVMVPQQQTKTVTYTVQKPVWETKTAQYTVCEYYTEEIGRASCRERV